MKSLKINSFTFKGFLIALIIYCFCISNLYAGEITYFAPDGSTITGAEYKNLAEQKRKIINDKKKQETISIQNKTDEFGRPMYDSKGNKIHYVERNQKEDNAYQTQAVKTNDDMPYDIFGRPLKTAEGNWITYPGDEHPSSHSYYGSSFSRSSLKSDMSAARWADTYKSDYLKSGKMTDLMKYRDASRKAMGLGNMGQSDMSSAYKADRYKKKYLESGSTVDLLKYRDASRKAMGLDN